MNKIKLYIIALLISSPFVSCNDWMDLYPDNMQTTGQYWQSKEDVEAVVAAGYVRLRECVEYMFVWGEMRGESVGIASATANDNIKAAQKLREVDITPSNMYAKWDKFYKVIGLANSVLEYGANVRQVDPSLTEGELNSYYSEAYFLRSLAYFYLVRTFKEVPLILYAYVEDDQDFNIPKSTEEEVLDQIIEDLKLALKTSKDYYSETNLLNPRHTKGRATRWAINALLADVYLWKGDYDECIKSCNNVIDNNITELGYNKIDLVSTENWFTNYYPGNSIESIFEIQYDYSKNQKNDFVDWFATTQLYTVTTQMAFMFEDTRLQGDIRGANMSYYNLPTPVIWKYVGVKKIEGTAQARPSDEYDQNFIIYRLAEIYLMKAEALIMQGKFGDATEIIAKVRERAGIVESLSQRSTEYDMLSLLMWERARELFGEGKRWYDLLRMARRHDYAYKEYMITYVLTALTPGQSSIARSKLADPNAHYLPIHQDEIAANKMLEQNPYYDNIGK